MDTLTFVTKVLESIAWPTTIVIFSLLFRHSISRVIESVRLKKLKRGDLEIDFGQEINELREESKVLPAPQKTLPTKTAKRISFQPTESSKDEDFHIIAQVNPVAAIALSWGYVDREIRSAITRLGISSVDPIRRSSYKNIQLLKRHNSIDEATFDILMRLRQLRDSSANLTDDPGLTIKDAEDFQELAQSIIEHLATIKPTN